MLSSIPVARLVPSAVRFLPRTERLRIRLLKNLYNPSPWEQTTFAVCAAIPNLLRILDFGKNSCS